MKSQYLKKKTVKRLEDGHHSDLMCLIEEAVDIYMEESFERGHQSFFGDAPVHAHRLSLKICEWFQIAGFSCTMIDKDTASINVESDDIAKIIEEYFNSLKK